MPRSQNKVASHRRRKRIMKQAKGYWGARSKVYTVAKHHVEKAMQYAYRDRKTKKRNFRQLWITRINAAARLNGTTYSRLMDGLHKKRVDINRKLLADMAVSHSPRL
jgi:large subunit ribosomal protein L20